MSLKQGSLGGAFSQAKKTRAIRSEHKEVKKSIVYHGLNGLIYQNQSDKVDWVNNICFFEKSFATKSFWRLIFEQKLWKKVISKKEIKLFPSLIG